MFSLPGRAFSAELPKCVYFQPSYFTEKYTIENFEKEMTLLKEAGIRCLWFNFVVNNGGAFYPSKAFTPTKPNLLPDFLHTAEKLGMDVYLGTATTKNWYEITNKDKTVEYYAKERRKSAESIREVYALYGKSKAIKGWYISHEFGLAWMDDERMMDFYAGVAKDIKEITGGGTVVVSPWLGKAVWSDKETAKWERFLTKCPIDIIAVQDGVGAHDNSPESVVDYFKHLPPIFKKHGRILWGHFETYEILNKNKPGKKNDAALPDRVLRQFDVEGQYVEEIVLFDMSHYMNPDKSERGRVLYNAVKKRYIDKTKPKVQEKQ